MRINGQGIDITALEQNLRSGTTEPNPWELSEIEWQIIINSIVNVCMPDEGIIISCRGLLQLYTLDPTKFPAELQTYRYRTILDGFLADCVKKEKRRKEFDDNTFLYVAALAAKVYGMYLPPAIMQLAQRIHTDNIDHTHNSLDITEAVELLLPGKLLLPNYHISFHYPIDIFRRKNGNSHSDEIKFAARVKLIWPAAYPYINLEHIAPPEKLIAAYRAFPMELLRVVWALKVIFSEHVFIDSTGIQWGDAIEVPLPWEASQLPTDIIY